MERDVVARQVGHGGRRLGGHPVVVLALVERALAARPVVVEALEVLHAEVVGRRPERQRLLARVVGLVPDGLAAGQGHRARVSEASDAAQRTEVVVEGTILLHQDHDVLYVGDGAGRPLRGDGGGARDALVEHGQGGGAAGELEKAAAVEFCHGERDPCFGGEVLERPQDIVHGVPEREPGVTAAHTPGERQSDSEGVRPFPVADVRVASRRQAPRRTPSGSTAGSGGAGGRAALGPVRRSRPSPHPPPRRHGPGAGPPPERMLRGRVDPG